MTNQEIVLEALSKELGVTVAPNLELRLEEDLGLDSLGVFSVFLSIEEKTGKRIDANVQTIANAKTISDIVNYVGSI